MKILSINNQQNQTTYKAVNPKYFKQAKAKYARSAPYHNLLPEISNITLAATYGLLSKQDAIDTLEAIKPFAQNQSIVEAIDEDIEVVKGMFTNQ